MNYKNHAQMLDEGKSETSSQFEKEYFRNREYRSTEALVKRNVLEVVSWATSVSGTDFFSGRGKKALDVGCAYGYSSQILGTLGYETYGIDVSRWGVKQARTNSHADFLICDAQTPFPFRPESFDLVTCFDVLEHLRFPERAIRNMLDTCRGWLICTTPNRRVEKPVRRIMGDFDETHISAKSPSEWESNIRSLASDKLVKVETFFDLTAKLDDNRVFFKSFKLPTLGLTVRILVKK